MSQHALRGYPEFGGAACAQTAVAVVYLQFNGIRSRCLVGDRGDISNRALDGLSRGQPRLRGLPGLHVTGVEFRDARRYDDFPVIDETSDRITHLDEVTHFDMSLLKRPVERRSNRHVLEVQLCPLQLGPGRLQLCNGLLQLGFGDVALALELLAALEFHLALPHRRFRLGEPRLPVAFVQPRDDGIAIHVCATTYADVFHAAVGFGGDVNNPCGCGLTVDDDRAHDFFGRLGTDADGGLLGRCGIFSDLHGRLLRLATTDLSGCQPQ